MSEEFKHTQTTITMVTAGRLLSELQDGKVTFKPITLLLLDETSGIHHETSLQDLVQVNNYCKYSPRYNFLGDYVDMYNYNVDLFSLSLLQLYSEARRLEKIGRHEPQMVGFTSQPNSGRN